jgi:hypothetical protein
MMGILELMRENSQQRSKYKDGVTLYGGQFKTPVTSFISFTASSKMEVRKLAPSTIASTSW